MKRAEPSDSRLIERIRAGDQQAFASLIERHRARMFGVALSFVKDREDAEEIVQEATLAIHRRLDQFQGKARFTTWLYRIVVNLALMRLRSTSRPEIVPLDQIPESLMEDSDAGFPSEERMVSEQTLLAIEKVVGRLPYEFEAILILRDIEGFSNQETAEIMELSPAAVKSRLHRARKFLRDKLKGLYQETVEN